MALTVFAIAAHPDDIEFMMGGTLLLLKAAGCRLHYLTVSSGNCGSSVYSAARTRAIRRAESQEAARLLGAEWHASLALSSGERARVRAKTQKYFLVRGFSGRSLTPALSTAVGFCTVPQK